MLRKNERLCKCGCGEIIDLKNSNYIVKENLHRNSYYVSKYHLKQDEQEIYDWMKEKGFIKEM